MKKYLVSAVTVAAFIGGAATTQAAVRDTISIVGSSTVYPFATVVAERFGRSTNFKTPKIESTGSGGGLKLFCKGVGASTPDVTNSSRRIKQSEYDDCQNNGVTEIVEVLVGFDGIALANAKSAPVFKLSLKDIYLALAKDIPGPDGKLVAAGALVTDLEEDGPADGIERLRAGRSCRLLVFNAGTGDLLLSHRMPGRVTSLSFSADGKTLAIGTDGKGVIFWDPQTLEPKGEIPHTSDPPRNVQVAFSPTANLLAVGGKNDKGGFLTVWDLGQP